MIFEIIERDSITIIISTIKYMSARAYAVTAVAAFASVASAWTTNNQNNHQRHNHKHPRCNIPLMMSSPTALPENSLNDDDDPWKINQSASPIMLAYEHDATGREHQQRGALNAAVSSYTEALSCHPSPDRHFRLGLALMENGEPQLAIDSFHSAREMAAEDYDTTLRHDVSLKMAHCQSNDLGNVSRGIQEVDAALSERGYGDSAPALDQKAFFVAAEGDLEEAIRLWDAALLGCDGGSDDAKKRLAELGEGVDDDARFFRAIAKDLIGRHDEAEADFGALPSERDYMVNSWRYVAAHPPASSSPSESNDGCGWHSRIFSGTHANLASALSASRPDGLVCEFGVFHGKSIRLLASMVSEDKVLVDGFDTFDGIPEDWGKYAAGSYTAASEVPSVPKNVRFHVGLFADTLPGYVASLAPAEELPVRFVNVDCDLYGGTVDILKYLAPRIGPGTVIVFDEYLMNSTWREDEHLAWKEACEEFGWEYEYLSFSLFSKQVVVRVTKSDSFVGPLPS